MKLISEKQLGAFWLTAVGFGVGAGVMAVEIIASRVLAPNFGASLFVWTSLILTVLIALAFGYWMGGIAAERGAGANFLAAVLAAASTLLTIGIVFSRSFSVSFLDLFAEWTNATAALFLSSLLASIVIFSLPVLLLGMLGPVIVKRLSDHVGVAKASGRYLAWSTIGSVVGTVVPTIFMIPMVGSRLSVIIVAALFLIMAALTVRLRTALLALFIGVLVLPSVAWLTAPRAAEALVERETPYQLIRVFEDNGWRYLTFNEASGTQSVLPPDGERTNAYFDYVGLLPLLRPSQPHRGLIVGLSGAATARTYRAMSPDSHVDLVGVELDSAVIDIAQEYFRLGEADVAVINDDGRSFLRTTTDRFDSMLIDAYSTQLYIPPHLVSREFFVLAKSRLRPGGVLTLNLNVSGADAPLYRYLTNTLAAVFPEVVAVPLADSWNWMIFASDEPIDLVAAAGAAVPGFEDIAANVQVNARRIEYDEHAPVFTDDWSPVEYLTETMTVQAALQRR